MADTLQRINLNNLLSSGIYTFEIDESQNISLPLTTGRLIIGSSKKGPVNSVVSITDLKTARLVFGDIDTQLENKGSFFHRAIEVSLREGPVYALNVLPVDDDDKVWFTTFNTEGSAMNTNNLLSEFNQPLSDFYNTQRLWYADSNQLNKTKNIALGDDFITNPGLFGEIDADSNKIFSFANLGKKPMTVWVKIADVTGYDLTVKEYYGQFGDDVEVPAFLHPDDLVSDYFVEIFAIEGNWTDNVKLSNDPVWKQYFNERGLMRSKVNNFLSQGEVKVVLRTVGSLIPDFKDQTGTVVSIDKVINRIFVQTEVLCGVDHDKLELIDLTESSFTDSSMQTHRVDLIGHGFDQLLYMADDSTNKLVDILSYRQPSEGALSLKIAGDLISGTIDSNPVITGSVPAGPNDAIVVDDTVTPKYIVAYENSSLYTAWKNGFIKNTNEHLTSYVRIDSGFTATISGNTYKFIKLYQYADVTLVNREDVTPTIAGYYDIANTDLKSFKKVFDLTDTNYFTSYSILGINKIKLTINSTNKTTIDEFIKPNNYIKAKLVGDSRPRFLKILSVSSSTTLSPSETSYTVTTMVPSAATISGIYTDNNELHVYKGVKNFIQEYKGFYLDSFKLLEKHLPNKTADRQDDILGFIYNDTNIAKTLADGETVDFRYIIDSYEGQIAQSSKYYLAKIAADHGKCLAILNSPSFAQFEKSVDPSFIDIATKLVSPAHISTGGNLDLNPSFTFKFADGDVNGIPVSTYAAYFMPNLIIIDNGRNRSVPPAPYVGNAFMRKYSSGNTFSIVGAKKGILLDPEIVEPEYFLTKEDRDYLEPTGFNLIVKRRGFGNMILSNNLAYQRVRSALNNIHVREALITIEKDIERILFNFLFDFNDEITQLRVKSIVKNYLDAVLAARGISYYEVQIDAKNNTNEIIENNAALLDIRVDFPRGIHKFINRITITRVGGQLSSSQTGFTPSF